MCFITHAKEDNLSAVSVYLSVWYLSVTHIMRTPQGVFEICYMEIPEDIKNLNVSS